MTEKANRLLCCAISYKTAEIGAQEPLPLTFDTVEAAIDRMMGVLWHEARADYEKPIEPPEQTAFHPVDMDTDEPGIIAAADGSSVLRRRLPAPAVRYQRRRPPPAPAVADEAVLRATIVPDADAPTRALKAQQTQAARDLKAEEKSLRSLARREEQKRKREEETPEEREKRLEEARAKRKERKEQKERERAEAGAGEGEEERGEAGGEGEEERGEAEGDATADGAPSLTETPSFEAAAGLARVDDLARALEDDGGGQPDAQAQVLPRRIKARERSKLRYYPNPVPHDRHLAALEAAWPSDALRDALLRATPCDALRIIQGPPGTGKTTRLLEEMRARARDARVLVCAPTNIGTLNLYKRALSLGIDGCALVMAPSKIPEDVRVDSQDPSARVVFATVSSRCGGLLDGQEFEQVYVDEAAQCMEPWVWGLLRPTVVRLVLAGDVRQLPALTSDAGRACAFDRSLMQRLMQNDYPAEALTAQRRMHPEILHFPNRFYDGALVSEYTAHERVGRCAPYELVAHDGAESLVGTSFCNEREARLAVDEARELQQHYADVVIIAPYQAQCRLILSMKSFIPVHTVDSFQGREADAVVLSVVRSSDGGFLSDERRLTVALTRARHALRVVGHDRAWTSGCLADMREDAVARDARRAAAA